MSNRWDELKNLAKKSGKANRDRVVTFRVSWEESDIIERNAEHYGLTLSTWLRYAALMYDPEQDPEDISE